MDASERPEDTEHVDSSAPTEDSPRPRDPGPRARLGRYEIRRVIAQHGQGTLLEGYDPELGRTVAVKLVTARGDRDSGPERCEREARALARLDHPNIVTVFDIGPAEGGGRFFVMEYLRGARSLTEYAAEHGLSIAERVRLSETLCDAIAAGHAAGMIHRDLKPSNLLVDRDGRARVIDFGLVAGHTVDPNDELRSREVGGILGTARYMSPEHFGRDPDLVDERSDVYAMGVVLFELLTGELPYDTRGLGPEQLERAVRSTPARAPCSIDPRLRGGLSAVLLRALEKEPARRYQSLGEMRDDLRAWRAGGRPGARAGSPIDAAAARLGAAAARFPRGLAATAWLLAVCLVAVLAGPAQYLHVPVNAWWRAGLAHVDASLPAPRSTFDGLRAVTISDGTDLASVASRPGLETVDPDDPSSLRALYGAVLSRLAEASPRVVALDVGFRDRDDPGDAALVRGIEALRAAGSQVVVAASPWPASAAAAPLSYDADIVGRVAFGGITFSPSAPWQLDLAVLPPGERHAVPSLVLAAYASFVEPGAGFTVTPDPATGSLDLQFFTRGEGPGTARRAFRTESAPAGLIERDPGKLDKGVPAGSIVAYAVVLPPSDLDFARATLDAGRVLEMPLAELQSQVGSRAVIIGLSRWGADLHRAPDGRTLAGYQVHMVALDRLLDHKPVRYPTPAQETLIIALGGLLGLAGALPTLAGRGRRLGLLGATTLAMMVLAAWMFHARGFVWNPLPFLLAGAIVGAGVARLAAFRRLRGLAGLSGAPLGKG